MSSIGAIFVPSPPQTGTDELHPPPPPIVEPVGGYLKDVEPYEWILGHKNSPIHEGYSILSHNWQIMVRAVLGYIKGINFKYRADLRSKGVYFTWNNGHIFVVVVRVVVLNISSSINQGLFLVASISIIPTC